MLKQHLSHSFPAKKNAGLFSSEIAGFALKMNVVMRCFT
jgi:hypothetical protein